MALDIVLRSLGTVRLQGTLRLRDVDKLRDVIMTYPGSPATSFDMTGVSAVDSGAAEALKKALDGTVGEEGRSFSIRVCAGEVADALRTAGFGPGSRYHLSVRDC